MATHLLGKKRKLHKLLVFVAVAYNQGVVGYVCSKNSMQLRFGTRLKAYVEFHAVAHNLLDHRAHLVHLYRVDDEVFRFIAVLFRFCCQEYPESAEAPVRSHRAPAARP